MPHEIEKCVAQSSSMPLAVFCCSSTMRAAVFVLHASALIAICPTNIQNGRPFASGPKSVATKERIGTAPAMRFIITAGAISARSCKGAFLHRLAVPT